MVSDAAIFDSLTELALNLRWSWNHATDELWRELDPAQWRLTHNPWAILQTVSKSRLQQVLSAPGYRQRVLELIQDRRAAIEAPAWFQKEHPATALVFAAYFSMEFMLSEALPIYSGGLGNVAGDQLKAASDLGVPVVGVGLLYAQGYFRQVIDRDGAQQALYPYNDPGQLPVVPLRRSSGEWLRLEIAFPGYSVWLRAWQVKIGRVALYLLDSNDMANPPAFRGITSELYGGGAELRLQQEIVLGIGGWRLLSEMGIAPEVCHFNEGHAAFAVLERARQFMSVTGLSFEDALTVTRAGNVFTTHTAVPAGFDRFTPSMIGHYLGHYATSALRISPDKLMALGRLNAGDATESFNMAYLSLRGSGRVNGVSRLHGDVSRRLFQPLFPRWPADEVPVGHVTNGIHTPSWDCAEADALWTTYCGKDRWLGAVDALADDVRRIPDDVLWKYRGTARAALIDYVRGRMSTQWAVSGMAAADVARVSQLFDAGALTLGFARRFATYKRPNLLLQDPERLIRLLSNRQRRVQLLIAGKAHPADVAGQDLIRAWIQFSRRDEVRSQVVFLSDYDMLLTERMVQGVDVWINTPQRPWEACGTSGMKVLVNGGLNVSELDGWWAEAYTPETGWAIGDGRNHDGDPLWDAQDSSQLFDLLETEVIPQFYARDTAGIPRAWIQRVRESMASLTPQYSANRSVRDYVEQCYLPAAAAFRARAAQNGALGTQIVRWQQDLTRGWPTLRFGRVGITHGGDQYEFTVELARGVLAAGSIRVELFANARGSEPPFCKVMSCSSTGADCEGRWAYVAAVPADRPPADYTARVVAAHDGVSSPLEAAQILWQS